MRRTKSSPGIHRRYDRAGIYDEESAQAQMAHRVRRVIGAAPVLLLTATPIQNSLRELWGLVQYVDPSGTLLGDKPVFEDVLLRRRRPWRRRAPGGGTEGAAHHRGAAHAAPAGTGVPGPALRRGGGRSSSSTA